MKKILVLLAVFYSCQANAANFTDTIGAECGRILFHLNEYKYPKLYEAVNDRNTQFNHLEKCLELYQKTGGNIKTINTRYYRAYKLYGLETGICFLEDKNKKEACDENVLYTFSVNLTLSAAELYDKYSLIYNNDKSEEDSLKHIIKGKCFEATQEWLDEEDEIFQEISNQKEEAKKKGFFSWF